MNKQISIFACSYIPTIICLYFSNHSSKNSLGTLTLQLPIIYQFFADYISPDIFHFFEFICAICLLSTKCVAYFRSTSSLPLLLNRSSFPFFLHSRYWLTEGFRAFFVHIYRFASKFWSAYWYYTYMLSLDKILCQIAKLHNFV